MSAHTVPYSGWLCIADLDVGRELVQLEVQRDAGRHRPVALEHVAVEVDADDVLRAELVPHISHGLHSSVPSSRLNVMWPARWSL